MADSDISYPTIYGSTSNEYIDVCLYCFSFTTYSTNETRLEVALQYKRNNTGFTTSGTGQFAITINGVKYESSKTITITENGWVKAFQKSVIFSHDAAGNAPQVSISASGSIPGTTLTSSSVSGKINLPTIPKPTIINSLYCNSNYIDGVITAVYTPKSSQYYTRRIISVNVNGTLTEIQTKNLGQATGQQTHTMQFNETELSKIYAKTPNTATPIIRVTLQTYSNSGYTTKVGTDQSREITLSLPTYIAPTATLAVNLVNSNAWVASKNIYASGLSGATIKLTAEPGSGAELTSTTITYNGATYNAAELKITTLKKSGDIEFSAKATDSRGRSTTATKKITVLPYSAPAVVGLQSERGTYDGGGWVADNEGQDVRVIFKIALALKDKGNTCNIAFKMDGSAKSPNHGATTGLNSDGDYMVYFLGIDGDVSHTLAMTITDSVGNTGAAMLTVPTKHITIEFNDSGRGIAFGKTSEKDETFECAWDAEFGKTVRIGGNQINDFVIEQGVSGIWAYRRWNSGACELQTYHSINIPIDTAVGYVYRSEAISINLPFKVYDITTVVDCCDVSAWASTNTFRVTEGVSTVTYILWRPVSYKAIAWYTHIHVTGRWK